ncbi:unnamed protein product [Prorocentrum cordatum]|uniref:Uncharacterized protein n=1 Tax=Prorocentrum cordatum TaxID=2364126 RepID=A0ABN9R5I0_9DINO|nr:unnamed protein product [Polarella glacialis]
MPGAFDLGGWLRCSVDGLAEHAAVAVGLVSPEEVAPDNEVPVAELARRFSAEARALKDAVPADVGTWLCGPPKSLAGPSKAQIDETLQRWIRRLATSNSALEASVSNHGSRVHPRNSALTAFIASASVW